MLSPGDRVARYFPKRSTIPARACGTIRTVLASTRIAKRTRTTKNANTNVMLLPLLGGSWSGPQLVSAEYVRRGALDRHDVDRGAFLDLVVLVVGARGPDLSADLHATSGLVRQRLEHVATLSDQRLGAGAQRRAGVQPVHHAGPDHGQQPDGGRQREHDLDGHRDTEQGDDHAHERATGE